MKHDCDGNPSITNYSRGCRCLLCKSAKSTYERERRERANKARSQEPTQQKKPAGKRDNAFVIHDAFTREQILRARGML
jgi:hypothetical protein